MLGIENQSEVSHTMPVRNMLCGALLYGRQIQEFADAHSREGDHSGHSSGEYLSGFYAGVLLRGGRVDGTVLSARHEGRAGSPAVRLHAGLPDQFDRPGRLVRGGSVKVHDGLPLLDAFPQGFEGQGKMAAWIENEAVCRHLNTETALLLKQCA